MRALGLAARSIAWAMLLPGVVAGYVPWRFFGMREARFDAPGARTLAGLAIMAAGLAILGITIWEFAHTGRGTLSPADPPRTLVVAGLVAAPCVAQADRSVAVASSAAQTRLLIGDMSDSRGCGGRPIVDYAALP